jgi:hypothetical protein
MRYLFGFLVVCALGVVPLVGCGEGSECQSGCNDGDECTWDMCVDGACENPPKDCNPHSVCIIAWSCDPDVGCVYTNRPDGTDCPHSFGEGECRDGSCVLVLN